LKLCHFNPLPISATTAFPSATQGSLCPLEFRQAFGKRFKRFNLFTCRKASQCLQSKIDAYLGCILGQSIPRFFYCQSDKISTCTILDYRNSAWLFFNHSRPANLQSPYFGDREIVICLVPLESRSSKLSTLLISLAFKSWILCPAFKEIDVSSLQPPQALLQWN